jgi:hypothetical protein
MTDYPELMAVINAPDGISAAIKLPVRPDGALPYLLSEVRQEVCEMFTTAVRTCVEYGYETADDETTTEE